MNWLIIILGVILVFLLYQLYLIYISAPVSASNIFLGKEQPSVPISSINNGNKATYTIGFWIYVNTYTPDIGEFIRFGNEKSGSDLKNSLNKTSLYKVISIDNNNNIPNNVCTFSIDPKTPTLYANITTSKNGSNYTIESIPITTNLPIQTWVYVLLSVSTNAGYYADGYINGKLIVSQELKNQPANPGANSGTGAGSYKNTFNFGPLSDTYLTKISWIGHPIDPQTAWAYYNQGNGNPQGIGSSNSYHLEVEFTNNGNVNEWKIF